MIITRKQRNISGVYRVIFTRSYQMIECDETRCEACKIPPIAIVSCQSLPPNALLFYADDDDDHQSFVD